MQDLKDVTNNVHYENYRSKKLAAVTCNGVDTSKTKGQLTKYASVTDVHLLYFQFTTVFVIAAVFISLLFLFVLNVNNEALLLSTGVLWHRWRRSAGNT